MRRLEFLKSPTIFALNLFSATTTQTQTWKVDNSYLIINQVTLDIKDLYRAPYPVAWLVHVD